MKKTMLLLLLFAISLGSIAQIKWSETVDPSKVSWDNYSTSYLTTKNLKDPFIVVAVPNFGIAPGEELGPGVGGNAPLDLSFKGSLFRFKSNLNNAGIRIETNDSSEVYFIISGITKQNADQFEYRVLENGTKETIPWTKINHFSEIPIHNIEKGMAFLGGYKTKWGNYLAVEVRKKNAAAAFALAIVMWKERKPQVQSVYSNINLVDLLINRKNYWKSEKNGHPLEKLVLPPTENTVVLYLSDNIYKKEAIEYQILKDGVIYRDWKANEYDGGFIWLKELSPGEYTVRYRFSLQRHNVSEYQFKIAAAWHQTAAFKITLGSLLAAFAGFIYLFFKNRRQQKKLQIKEQDLQSLLLKSENLKSQLNPHFVFNTLSSIQSLINKQDSTQANLFLNKFSKLLRSTLESNQVEFIPIEKEQAFIADYLFLQSIRYNFKFEMQCAPELLIVEIPPFITQPIIENALLHGFSENTQNPFLKVLFLQRGQDLLIVVEDNGKGFDPSLVQKNHGLSITYQRIELLNQLKNEQIASINIESEPGKGSIFTITLKNWIQG